jgi:hypothetical protein
MPAPKLIAEGETDFTIRSSPASCWGLLRISRLNHVDPDLFTPTGHGLEGCTDQTSAGPVHGEIPGEDVSKLFVPFEAKGLHFKDRIIHEPTRRSISQARTAMRRGSATGIANIYGVATHLRGAAGARDRCRALLA